MYGPFSSFSLIKWEDNASEDDKKAYGNYGSTVGERYFQDGKYRTIAGDTTQAGWGSLVPPGYELIGSRAPVQNRYGYKHNSAGQVQSTTPGQLYLRRKDQPPPTPNPTPTPTPTPTPAPPSDPLPSTEASARYAEARERAQERINDPSRSARLSLNPVRRPSFDGYFRRSSGGASQGTAVESVAQYAADLNTETKETTDAMTKRAEASNYLAGDLLRRYAPRLPGAPAPLTSDQLIAMVNRMNNEIKIS